MFELRLINPVTGKTASLGIISKVYGIKVTKAFNDIGSFAFSYLGDIADFEAEITTPDGQAQVLIYSDGKPFTFGTINSYSPSSDNVVDVECVEILNILKEDVLIEGLTLTNWDFEYLPASSPAVDADFNEVDAYWGENGKSLFASEYYLRGEDNRVITIASESEYGLKVGNRPYSYTYIYPRKYIGNIPFRYTVEAESYGMFKSFQFISLQSWNRNSYDVTLPDREGVFVHMQVNPHPTSPYVNSWKLILSTCYGGTRVDLAEDVIDGITVDGKYIDANDFALYANCKTTYTFEEQLNGYLVSAKWISTIDDVEYVFEIPSTLVPKPANPIFNSAGGFVLPIFGTVFKYNIAKENKTSLLDWLKQISPNLDFIESDSGNPIFSQAVNKLSFDTGDRWQVASKIIEIMGAVSLDFEGVQGGKPVYRIYPYETLPNLYKFADGDEVFDVQYQKDYSDVFNILYASCTKEIRLENKTIAEKSNLTIAPNPDRPNRLGRLVKRIMQPDGIEDIETLTKWALAIYEEHSYPEEPIDFTVPISEFWLSIKLGQYITMHGIIQGKAITEQVNKLDIDESTGMVSVELAKRLTLKSALIQARLAAGK